MRRFLVLVGVLVVGCHTKSERPKPTQEQLAEIGNIFAASDASSGAVETAFQTAVKTVDAVAPGATPCAVPFTLDDDSRVAEQLASQLPTASIAHSTVRLGTATITGDRSQLASLTSASVEIRHEEEERLLDRVDDYAALDGAALVARAHQLAAQPLPTELLIVITAGRDPTLATGDTFDGGVALAHAYLYSPAERRFACAGNVSAESSGAVNTFLNPKDPTGKSDPNLTADLYLNLIEEAQHSLRATP